MPLEERQERLELKRQLDRYEARAQERQDLAEAEERRRRAAILRRHGLFIPRAQFTL